MHEQTSAQQKQALIVRVRPHTLSFSKQSNDTLSALDKNWPIIDEKILCFVVDIFFFLTGFKEDIIRFEYSCQCP